MSQESDISWQTLRRIVHDWAGTAAELAEVKPLDGGCINCTLALTTKTGERAVLKIAPHRVNRDLQRESLQLQRLARLGLPVPRVYQFHLADLASPDTWLLMEFIEGLDLHAGRAQMPPEEYDDLQRHFAEIVLAVHAHTGERYQRECVEDSPAFESWPRFYRHIYDPIWADVEGDRAIPLKVRRQIGKLHERLDRYVAHDDRPRLVHWDIWHSNVLVAPNGDGRWHVKALLDPMCKFAHAEAELAYLEMFHTTTPAFMKRYQQERKLTEAYYRVRRPIYQLYTMINDVHLHGHEYVKPLLQSAEKIHHLV